MLSFVSFKTTSIFRNVDIGSSFSLTNKSNFVVALCNIKGKILRWEKIAEWKERFTKCNVR